VEILQEILELNYRGLCIIVLVCNWVKANCKVSTTTVKKTNGDSRWPTSRVECHLAKSPSLFHFTSNKYIMQMHVKSLDGELSDAGRFVDDLLVKKMEWVRLKEFLQWDKMLTMKVY
jgi:hypothetical protein